MDELKIRTPLVKALISRILKSVLKKNLGCDIDVMLNDLSVTIRDGKAHFCVNAEGSIGVSDISRILKKSGLD